MIKNSILNPQYLLIIGTVFLMISCNIAPELAETSSTAATSDRSIGTFGGPVFSVPITLDRVRIFTTSTMTLSGTITVEIATTDGNVLGSSVLPGSSLIGNKWTTFYFAPVSLLAGTKYRLQVKRSSNGSASDAIHWGATDGSVDAYPKGGTSISGTHPPYDMAFVTYSSGYVDQQQTSYRYFWAIHQYTSWQEFVPEKIWIIQPS